MGLLAEIRNKRGMTQTELADACGISQKSISAIEVGRRRPSLEVLIRLAKALNVTVDELIGDLTETKGAESGSDADSGSDLVPEDHADDHQTTA